MNNYNLAFENTNYSLDRMEELGRWVVTLNNGQSIFQEDDLPDVHPASTWLRLKRYCKDKGLYIINMRLQFRSHVEYLPDNADGYFFVKSILANVERTFHLLITGTLNRQTGIVHCTSWRMPEIIVLETEERTFEQCKDLLITNDNV